MTNVVVIDDDRSVCEMIRRSLEKIDLLVSTASRAEEGLNSIRKESPDVVLLDIMLPGTSGLDVFQIDPEIERQQVALALIETGVPGSCGLAGEPTNETVSHVTTAEICVPTWPGTFARCCV